MALQIKRRRSTYDSRRNMIYHERRKNRWKRTFIASIVVVLMLLLSGTLYTWYIGKYSPVPVAQPIEEPVERPKTAETPVDETAKVGVAEQVFTRTVRQGDNASLQIKTNRLAACSITVEYDKRLSEDTGLVPKKADEYGVVSWAWTVEPTRPVGRWPVTVTCANEKNSAVHIVYLTVEKKE